jgi:adenylate cyclase class 2
MIEAEIKARVRDPARVRDLLRARAPEEASRYWDTYYDLPGLVFHRSGRELRLRVIGTGRPRRCLLACKGAAIDEATGSRPETETEIGDPDAMDLILLTLGYGQLVAFEKHCASYAFTARGRDMLATLVTLPELEGTFLELETMTGGQDDLDAALSDIRAVLGQLGIDEADLTTELYTEAVMRHRPETDS